MYYDKRGKSKDAFSTISQTLLVCAQYIQLPTTTCVITINSNMLNTFSIFKMFLHGGYVK